MEAIDKTEEWRALESHWQEMSSLHMRDLFAADSGRFQRYSLQLGELLFDFSKNRITDKTLDLLVALAERAGLKESLAAMYDGDRLNFTEQRAALHVALRNRGNSSIYLDGNDVMPEVRDSLDRMGHLVNQIRSGQWKGCTGKPITDVVNIGIGGSDLGPKLVTKALKPFHSSTRVHFVSNLDGTQICEILSYLEPQSTLFIISSKSFGTLETLLNAQQAKHWLLERGGLGDECIPQHFLAVTCNREKAMEFGIPESNLLHFWDWVGGRFSLWSAIGLPIALAVGMGSFTELLEGAHEMDEHFRTQPFRQNMPVMLALLGIWYRSFAGFSNHAIFPYDEYLSFLPFYIQQLDMESNGKSVSKAGEPIHYGTAPIIWGNMGADGQHSYFQLLHQGREDFSCDFIASIIGYHELDNNHHKLLANMLAQAEAMMAGRTLDEAKESMREAGASDEQTDHLSAFKTMSGNHPSNVFLLNQLTAKTLGALLALYEHKIFVQGIVWQVNSFDQWGVELGKQLASGIADELDGGEDGEHDNSTQSLVEYCRRVRSEEFN